MKRLFKTISVLGVLLIAVVVAAVAVLSSLDFNDYKGEITAEVEKATGREMTISGDLKLNISLTPSLYVDGVTFANASWGSRPQMMTLKRLEAEVALLPLLSSEIDVKRLVLVGLDLLAETDKQGRGNWQFGAVEDKAPAAESGSGKALLPVVRKVRIEDLRLTYRDGQTGKETRLTLPKMDLGADSTSAPLRIALEGDVNGERFSADGTIASIKQLTSGAELPLDLKARTLGAEATVRGVIADPKSMTGLAVSLAAKGDSISATAQAAAKMVPDIPVTMVPDLGPYDISLTVTGSSAKPSISNLKASLGRSGETKFTVAGAISNAVKASGIDLQIAATIAEPTGLAKTLGIDVPPLPGIKVAANVSDGNGGYRLGNLALMIGASDLKGAATAYLGSARPRILADLQSTLLDLDELLPKGDSKQAPPSADGRLFSADPLPFDGLKAADADVKLAVAKVRVNKMDVRDVRLGVMLKGGNLVLNPVQAVVADGRISGDVNLGADQAVPPLGVNLNVAKLDYGKLVVQMGQKPIAEGTADATVRITGAGTSLRQIMAGLDGKLRLVSEKGRIESSMLNVASADIMSALPLVDSKGDKDLRCAVVDFDIVKGLANAKAMVVETGGLSVVGVGGVNLRDETLNLVLEPRAKKTSLLSAAIVPVAVRGTLAKPEPKVNPADLVTGVASNVASGAAAVMTFGLSVLAESVFNRATSTDGTDYCALALAGKQVTPTKGSKKPSTSGTDGKSPPAQQEKPKSGIGGALENIEKGIGGGLKGLFGK